MVNLSIVQPSLIGLPNSFRCHRRLMPMVSAKIPPTCGLVGFCTSWEVRRLCVGGSTSSGNLSLPPARCTSTNTNRMRWHSTNQTATTPSPSNRSHQIQTQVPDYESRKQQCHRLGKELPLDAFERKSSVLPRKTHVGIEDNNNNKEEKKKKRLKAPLPSS